MTRAIDLASKESYLLVRAAWAGGSKRWTDWNSDVTFEGQKFTATPSMEVKLPENDGLLTAQDCRIKVPLLDDPTDFTQRISSGLPFPPTTIEVIEVIAPFSGGPEKAVLRLFIGDLEIARRNFNRSKRTCILQALTLKSKLETVALGEPANLQCTNLFGGHLCKVNALSSPYTVQVVVEEINGASVRISNSVSVTSQPDRFYHRGTLTSGGLKLTIRDWRSSDPRTVLLTRQPPDFWLGASAYIRAGCDGAYATCRDRHANTDNFNGRGISVPAYHPVFEKAP